MWDVCWSRGRERKRECFGGTEVDLDCAIARVVEKKPSSTASAKSSTQHGKITQKDKDTGCGLTWPLDRSRFGRRHGPTVL
jgi:hypothetical protein